MCSCGFPDVRAVSGHVRCHESRGSRGDPFTALLQGYGLICLAIRRRNVQDVKECYVEDTLPSALGSHVCRCVSAKAA